MAHGHHLERTTVNKKRSQKKIATNSKVTNDPIENQPLFNPPETKKKTSNGSEVEDRRGFRDAASGLFRE